MTDRTRCGHNSEDGGAECGSASIWLLTATCLVVLVGVLAMTTGGISVGRMKASGAADLAALAAAQHLMEGAACRRAAEAAHRNEARLISCWAGTTDVAVTVEVTVRLPLGMPTGVTRASARAGPAWSAASLRAG